MSSSRSRRKLSAESGKSSSPRPRPCAWHRRRWKSLDRTAFACPHPSRALPLAYSHLHPCQNLIATQEAGHGSRKNQSSGAFRLEPEAAMAFEELFRESNRALRKMTGVELE